MNEYEFCYKLEEKVPNGMQFKFQLKLHFHIYLVTRGSVHSYPSGQQGTLNKSVSLKKITLFKLIMGNRRLIKLI